MDNRSHSSNERSNLRHIGLTSIITISRESDMKNELRSSDLIADLTWADLYARQIRQDLNMLTPAVRKVSTSAELTEVAARLRDQLEGAHRTMSELRTMTGSEPLRSK